MSQIVQGLNRKKEKGVITNPDTYALPRFMWNSAIISENETENVVVGAFVKRDFTVSTEGAVVLASATDPANEVGFVVRQSIIDDIAGSSQGSITDVNGLLAKTKPVLHTNKQGYEFYGEAGDAIDAGEYVMIDDTDDSRSTLIPYADAVDPAPANYKIARALETAGASGDIILFQFI